MKKELKKYFPFCFKDLLITVVTLASAFGICFFFRIFDDNVTNVSMTFILAVFIISRFTDGYLFGILSAFVSVLEVNYIFTYPYNEFNFTLSGYPITIFSMLVVAVITSAMTTQIKEHSEIRLEAEKEKTRSNLLRAVSHDLRTPLTSILGASSAIIENDNVITKQYRINHLKSITKD